MRGNLKLFELKSEQREKVMKNILIISSSLGDLNGFVEHLEEYKIAGKIYAANVMDAGLVKNQSVFQKAYDMGYSI